MPSALEFLDEPVSGGTRSASPQSAIAFLDEQPSAEEFLSENEKPAPDVNRFLNIEAPSAPQPLTGPANLPPTLRKVEDVLRDAAHADEFKALQTRYSLLRDSVRENPEQLAALNAAYKEHARALGVEAIGAEVQPMERVTGEQVRRAFPELPPYAADAIAGVQQGSAGLSEGMVSLEGLPMFVPGAVGKVYGKAFLGSMAAATPEMVKEFSSALGAKDTERAFASGIPLALTPVMIGAGLKRPPSAKEVASRKAAKIIEAEASQPLSAEAFLNEPTPKVFSLSERQRLRPLIPEPPDVAGFAEPLTEAVKRHATEQETARVSAQSRADLEASAREAITGHTEESALKAQNEAAREFRKLVLEYGHEANWFGNSELVETASLDSNAHQSSGIPAKILRSKEVQRGVARALSEMGGDAATLDNAALQEFLPALQVHVNEKFVKPVEQVKAFESATAKGKQAVAADDLKVDAILEIEGEKVKVVEVDPDTGDVTLQDGTKFGRQKISSGETIHVEKMKEPTAEEWLAEDPVGTPSTASPTKLPEIEEFTNYKKMTADSATDYFDIGEFRIWKVSELPNAPKGAFGMTSNSFVDGKKPIWLKAGLNQTEVYTAINHEMGHHKLKHWPKEEMYGDHPESVDSLLRGSSKRAPKLRPMEQQGDLMATQTEDFALTGERGTDAQRVQRAQAQVEQSAAEAKAIQEKQQTVLFDPVSQNVKRSSAIGDPLTPAMPPIPAGVPAGVHASGRMPVAMDRILPGQISVPEVMAGLENIIHAAGGTAPIRTGRFSQQARGIYKEFPEVIRLRQADNIPTAAHEVAHAIAKHFWGTAGSQPLKVLPKSVRRELLALGKALYGSTKPAAGYTAEGWSEFVRLWLTTEDAAKRAPNVAKWFEAELFPKYPAVTKALKASREQIDLWRGQGAESRARAQMQEPPGKLARLLKVAQDHLCVKAQVEEFSTLEELSKGYQEIKGSKLPLRADPFLLATARRGSAGKVLENFVERGTQDLWGNVNGPSLREALAPVKPGQAEAFAQYLWSRRAVERWAKKQNPGMALEDAQFLKAKLETPAFQLAADAYYKWWDGVLDYYASASPSNAELVTVIRASSHDYVPLARILDESLAKSSAVAMGSSPLKKMRGSGRPIRDIYQQSLLNAERIIGKAHKDMVLESVFKLSETEGMGWLVEEVPLDKVAKTVNIDQIRADLEKLGVDTTPILDGELLTYFTPSTMPKGVDPIMVRRTPAGPKWYQVPSEIYELLNGLDTPRLGPVADFFLGMPGRAFKMGTTGLRASFSLVTNPIRDFPTFLAQSVSEANPAARAGAYLRSMFDVVRAGVGGKESEALKVFHQLGISSGTPLGGDIGYVRREAKGLFHGKMFKRVVSPVETLREILGFTEAIPRLAELRLVGSDYGWKPGQRLTPEQALAMTIAARRVTTDFSAGGSLGKLMNQAIPFYNPVIQGTRAFMRSFKGDQGIGKPLKPGRAAARAMLYGLTLFTLPTLFNWWRNKDEEWYRQLPWRERYLYTNVSDDKGRVWQIPRPQEWGNAFMIAPEMLLDLWHTQDPRGAEEGLKHIFETQNPMDYPVLAKIAKEQWQNRIDFFDRPIVPRNQVDLPPGQQFGPYTTKLARWIGEAFPNQMSPRRIDAGVRGYFGGTVPDLLEYMGLGSTKTGREREAADFPVYGRLARRGGEFSSANQSIADFYDTLTRYRALANGTRAKAKAGAEVSNEDARDMAYSKYLDSVGEQIKAAHDMADRTANPQARAALYRRMGEEARQAMKNMPKETQ